MKRILSLLLAALVATTFLSACNTTDEEITSGAATDITAKANQAFYDRLDFSDKKEYDNATKGLIEAPESVVIYNEDGSVAWSVDALGDLTGATPDEVNPSLWRNTQLNAYAGLFEVCDGIYQVR